MTDYTALLQDAILDNSKIRDGLTDTEAQPLIDWGLQQAELVTDDTTDEARYEELYGALPRLLMRMNWFVTYTPKKGADFGVKTMNQINNYAQTIYGKAKFNEDAINDLIAMVDGGADVPSVLEKLMRQIQPPVDGIITTEEE
jgi:hypothetical protein